MTKLYWIDDEKLEHFDSLIKRRYDRFLMKGKSTPEEAALKSRRFALLTFDLLDNDDEYVDIEQVFLPKWFTNKKFDSYEGVLLTPEKETEKAILFQVKGSTTIRMNDCWIPKSLLSKTRNEDEN